MPTARSKSLLAVLPGNQLMVVGGRTDDNITDEVEIATLKNRILEMRTICMYNSSVTSHITFTQNNSFK